MATYKGIHGTKIQDFTSDPANPLEGQVWYNETDNVLKYFYINPGSWSTGGDLNTARSNPRGTGTQTAALSFGGKTPALNELALTESYNGSTWAELNDLNTARTVLGGAGTSTAALAFGGENGSPGDPNGGMTAATESWNGTSWTEVNDLNAVKQDLGGAGTQTSALAFGGNVSGVGIVGTTETWNGTNWTEVNDLNTARQEVAGGGANNTSALCLAGEEPAVSGKTESWNGTNWTEVNDLNTVRRLTMGSAGTQTSHLFWGGYDGSPPIALAITESWNGTNWTEVADLNIGRNGIGGAGAGNTSALAFGGNLPGATAATEEWSVGPATVTITTS